MRNWKKDLADITRTNSKKFNTYPDLEVLNNIYRYVETNNYTQMLFNYGKEYVLLCLKYFQEVEDYERCAIIVRQVKNFNQVQGTKIELIV